MLETSAFKSLWWPIHIINPVDKTKLSCNRLYSPPIQHHSLFRNFTQDLPVVTYLTTISITSISSSKATLNEMIEKAILWEKNTLNKDGQGC